MHWLTDSPRRVLVTAGCLAWLAASPGFAQPMTELRGTIVDAATNQALPARVYLRSQDGQWFFARSAEPQGNAVEYRKERGPQSVEMHTTLSAHPFVAMVPPGIYRLTVERGKEYLSHTELVDVTNGPRNVTVPLRRWIDMAARGWYAGDTHVHRPLAELPTAMLADDLNVALPLTYWVTRADTAPSQGDKNSPPVEPKLVEVDRTHVIYPMNTEYEIFTVGGKPHTLGAVFGLNHRTVLDLGVPPVRPVAERVHAEGGLLELDKHNWPWSMMLVPVMDVDLYELSNNHVWRTDFMFRQFGESPPPYMKIERDERGFTERGWLDFTFQNYYLLLNCGFRLRPTAGTASGVHPVPLGWGRVYVHLPDGFSYDRWIDGLNAGRSFVTTGPMLLVTVEGMPPGSKLPPRAETKSAWRLRGSFRSEYRQTAIEVVSAGRVVHRIQPANRPLAGGGFESDLDAPLAADGSSWWVVRGWEETPAGRPRFAHTAPFYHDDPTRPLRPRPEELDYLRARIRSELERHRGVLPAAAIAEYESALQVYDALAQ